MTISDARFRRHARRLAVACLGLLTVVACSDNQTPAPVPAGIKIDSGDNQYTRKGTELEQPVVMRVTLEDGSAAAGVDVHFQVTAGGGSLSRTSATTLSDGRTNVRWTMGPSTGPNQLRATVTGTSLSATATATSSEYYCPEEDPTFTQKFFSAHDMMMVTRFSDHTPGSAGLLRFLLKTDSLSFDLAASETYPDGAFINVVRDCAFAANGDLYISWNNIRDEIVKVDASDYSVSHFATLETLPLDVPTGAEIAMTPKGVLVGCDAAGPFYVTCRDSSYRFEDAVFTGEGRDAANNDALACNPVTGDVYFIYKSDRRLYKIPFDGTTAGPKELVISPDAPLDFDVSDNARGMVVDGTDGSIYILVESTNTKAIMKVSGGTLTTAYDFFDRGAGDAAGIQSDLAMDRQATYRFLYTLDTKNNVILLYQLSTGMLFEMTPPANDPGAASGAAEGERVGIDIIANAAP